MSVCAQERHFLGVSNYVFTVIFTLEMMVKVSVFFNEISESVIRYIHAILFMLQKVLHKHNQKILYKNGA